MRHKPTHYHYQSTSSLVGHLLFNHIMKLIQGVLLQTQLHFAQQVMFTTQDLVIWWIRFKVDYLLPHLCPLHYVLTIFSLFNYVTYSRFDTRCHNTVSYKTHHLMNLYASTF